MGVFVLGGGERVTLIAGCTILWVLSGISRKKAPWGQTRLPSCICFSLLTVAVKWLASSASSLTHFLSVMDYYLSWVDYCQINSLFTKLFFFWGGVKLRYFVTEIVMELGQAWSKRTGQPCLRMSFIMAVTNDPGSLWHFTSCRRWPDQLKGTEKLPITCV